MVSKSKKRSHDGRYASELQRKKSVGQTIDYCYDRGGFPGDTLDRVREYGVNAQELVTTSSTRLLMTT